MTTTSHLTPEELIDSRERQLPSPRQAHAEACAVCQAKLAEIDEVLLDVAAVDIPEPSPLFWDHLSARIRDRVAHEPPPAAAGENPLARLAGWLTGSSPAPRWAFAAALIALCVSLGWLGLSELRRERTGPVTPAPRSVQVDNAQAQSPAPTAAADSAIDHDDSEWALMLQMAEDVAWDDAEGSSLYVRPAAVDRALIELTAEERDRLLQLVQAELAKPHQKS